MSFSIRAFLAYVASLEFFVCLAAVASASTVLAMNLLGLGLWDVLGLVPSKVFFALLLLNRLAGLLMEAWYRKTTAIISAGILVVLTGLALNYGYRFEGGTELGEGEPFREFSWWTAGPYGRTPEMNFLMEEVHGEADVAKFVGEGFGAPVPVGGSMRLREGLRLGVESVDIAPGFEIRGGKGELLASQYVKLRLNPKGTTDYFLVTPFPHRFYVSLSDDKSNLFKLRILRGKLVIASSEMAKGDEVEFDGLRMSLTDVLKWAQIRVWYSPGNRIIHMGLVITGVGCALAFLRRRA